MSDDPGGDHELAPREAARIRRRDQDAEAAARDLMRPGMGKIFKQILDAQAKAARDAASRMAKGSKRGKRPPG
jgi:hypothetical protein